MIVHWWSNWAYRTLEFGSIVDFLALVAPPLTFIVLAFLFTPNLPSEGKLDLRDYYFRNRRWLFGLAAILLVELSFLRSTIGPIPWNHPENLFRVASIATVAVLAFTQDARVHGGGVVVLYLLFSGFVALTQ